MPKFQIRIQRTFDEIRTVEQETTIVVDAESQKEAEAAVNRRIESKELYTDIETWTEIDVSKHEYDPRTVDFQTKITETEEVDEDTEADLTQND